MALFGKKINVTPLRGLINDDADIPEAIRCTSAQKVSHLELMLGQIANYCPINSRNTIVRNSTSVICIVAGNTLALRISVN